ncbi:MAG: DUF3568 family protein [Lentisphaerota bacterium]
MKIFRAVMMSACLTFTLLAAGCAGLGVATAVGAVVYFKGSHHESATVNLDAKPDKVYAAALETIEASSQARITKKDTDARLIEITQEKQKITLKITELGPNLTQLSVTSTVTKNQPGSTTAVLNRVTEICDKMGVAHHLVK